MLAPSIGWMLVARFAWGVGAGLPRVQAIAIEPVVFQELRDALPQPAELVSADRVGGA